jgi:hypothetical protein
MKCSLWKIYHKNWLEQKCWIVQDGPFWFAIPITRISHQSVVRLKGMDLKPSKLKVWFIFLNKSKSRTQKVLENPFSSNFKLNWVPVRYFAKTIQNSVLFKNAWKYWDLWICNINFSKIIVSYLRKTFLIIIFIWNLSKFFPFQSTVLHFFCLGEFVSNVSTLR